MSYAFDQAGRRVGLTVAGQPPVSYAYDDANRQIYNIAAHREFFEFVQHDPLPVSWL